MHLRNGSEAPTHKGCRAAICEVDSVARSIGSQLLVVWRDAKNVLQEESHGQYEKTSLGDGIFGQDLEHAGSRGHGGGLIQQRQHKLLVVAFLCETAQWMSHTPLL